MCGKKSATFSGKIGVKNANSNFVLCYGLFRVGLLGVEKREEASVQVAAVSFFAKSIGMGGGSSEEEVVGGRAGGCKGLGGERVARLFPGAETHTNQASAEIGRY